MFVKFIQKLSGARIIIYRYSNNYKIAMLNNLLLQLHDFYYIYASHQ
jgi:hypothetical protein